jgi:hypothetical protein
MPKPNSIGALKVLKTIFAKLPIGAASDELSTPML